jgi:hypothetical protein
MQNLLTWHHSELSVARSMTTNQAVAGGSFCSSESHQKLANLLLITVE